MYIYYQTLFSKVLLVQVTHISTGYHDFGTFTTPTADLPETAFSFVIIHSSWIIPHAAEDAVK